MSTEKEPVEGAESILTRRELLGASAALGTAAIASTSGAVGSASAQTSTEPRIQLGEDYAIDDNPDGEGDLVLEHLESGAQLRYDSSEDSWSVGSFSADDRFVTNVGLRVGSNIGQSIPSDSITTVQMESVSFDHRDEWDTTNHQFTAENDGTYLIQSLVTFQTPADQTRLDGFIAINGSISAIFKNTNSGGQDDCVYLYDFRELNSGDTLEIQVRQDSGTPVSLPGDGRAVFVTITQM